MNITIRLMTADDAPDAAALSGQIGYPTSVSHLKERFEQIARRPDSALLAADCSGSVVGWVHVYGVHLLESPASFAEIGGLVVHAEARRQGIGRRLMAEAERWAGAQGYLDVRLRSGLHRTEAHAFYQAIGYQLAKTAHLFQKLLST